MSIAGSANLYRWSLPRNGYIQNICINRSKPKPLIEARTSVYRSRSHHKRDSSCILPMVQRGWIMMTLLASEIEFLPNQRKEWNTHGLIQVLLASWPDGVYKIDKCSIRGFRASPKDMQRLYITTTTIHGYCFMWQI